MLLTKFATFAPLSLAYVAALTPEGWDIEILDENIKEFEYKEADLVGITSFTTNINRAYEIAAIYKEKGTKVVLGGIHASVMPDEAVNYVDAVVVGEAELVWGQLIEDFNNGCLKDKYIGSKADIKTTNFLPRRDLLSPEYFWGSIQTSRGCPFDCDFCSVSRYLGREYRKKSVDNILDELETIENEYVFFLDDNVVGYGKESEEKAIQLFKGMIDRKINKKWWMQTSINTGENEELLKYASESGCLFALVGIEAINEENLKTMKKGVNLKAGVDNFKRIINRFHKHGIAVLGAFIIGNDNDTMEHYNELGDFLIKAGVDAAQVAILTPLPGSALFDRLNSEGRLRYKDFPSDWSKYRLSHLVHEPIGVTDEVIYQGNYNIKKHIYSPLNFIYRMIKSLMSLKRLDSFFAIYKMNQAYKKSWLNSHYYKSGKYDK